MVEAPSWRKIEAALIELLREEGFEIKQERGESFITVYTEDGEWEYKHEINIGDLARHLADRLV